MIGTIKKLFGKSEHFRVQKSVTEAYDLWSDSYDDQPGNLMLDLDELIFNSLLQPIDLRNKIVVDVGCGTGRHWDKLYQQKPSLVVGFDVSAGMLDQLRRKHPAAMALRITDNRLEMLQDRFAECVITTLTIAHIEHPEEAIKAWSRVLKQGGDMIITDFHPAILAKGGRRSFTHDGKTLSVINYVHTLETVKRICVQHGLIVLDEKERFVDDQVRSYYEQQHALPVYRSYEGLPLIYGLHLKRCDAAQ